MFNICIAVAIDTCILSGVSSNIRRFFEKRETTATEISDKDWIELIQIAEKSNSIFLTGGEPMLIKKYYFLLTLTITLLQIYYFFQIWSGFLLVLEPAIMGTFQSNVLLRLR